MTKLICLGLLHLPASVRDVTFLDDDTILFTTPEADVWASIPETNVKTAARLFPARQVLNPVAKALGQWSVSPAAGGYPRLAASASAGVVVVNTHDFVLVGCVLNSEVPPRLIAFGWGEYYPRLSFSKDGSRFAAEGGGIFVCDSATWRGKEIKEMETSAWHPREPWLLCLHEYEARARWVDWSDVTNPAASPLGSFGRAEDRIEPVGLVVAETGDQCVAGFSNRLEWWQLAPPHLLATSPIENGPLHDVWAGPQSRVFAALSEQGIRIWDIESRMPVGEVIREATSIAFAPMGGRFVTFTHQYGRPPILWQIDR